MDVSRDEILELREGGNEHLNKQEELSSCPQEINHKDIRSRLRHLELELSSVLHTLRSNMGELPSQEVSDLIFMTITLGERSYERLNIKFVRGTN